MFNMHEVGADLDKALEDDSEWETPSRTRKPKSEQRQRGAMVSVRFTQAELERVQRAAAERGLSVAAFMREHALRAGTTTTWAPVVSHILQNATYLDEVTRVWVGETTISQYESVIRVTS